MRLQFFDGNEEVATDIMSKRSSTSNSLLYFGNPPQYSRYTLLASLMYCVLILHGLYCLCSPAARWILDTGRVPGAGVVGPSSCWYSATTRLLRRVTVTSWLWSPGPPAPLHHCTTLGQDPEQPRVAALQPRPSDLEHCLDSITIITTLI